MFQWGTGYDPVNERLVGRGQADDVLAFDTRTHEWTTLLEPTYGTARAGPGVNRQADRPERLEGGERWTGTTRLTGVPPSWRCSAV